MASKDRERELARRRHQRQLERRAARQAKNKQRMIIALVVAAVIAVILALVVTTQFTNGKGSSTGAGAQPTASAGATTAAPATTAAAAATPSTNPSPTIAGGKPLVCTAPPAKPTKPQTFAKEPAMTIDPKATYVATITTNCGVIKAELNAAKAPHTVNSFNFLAGKNYFNDSPCHRLTTGGLNVLQCGDPTGTGSGGPGYTIPDENLTGATYPAGTIAMANTGQPHSGGSQFFINYKDSQLQPQYTPFGNVTQGLDILQAIAAKGSNNANQLGDGAPNQPVSILSFTVAKSS